MGLIMAWEKGRDKLRDKPGMERGRRGWEKMRNEGLGKRGLKSFSISLYERETIKRE
jgi:hypothetical protein